MTSFRIGMCLASFTFMISLCSPNGEKVFHTDYNEKVDSAGRPLTRVVNTKYGLLRGFISTLPNRNLPPVEVYLGIPYASPPTLALRFMPPVTPAHWRGVRPAQEFSPVCMQNFPDIRNETEALKAMPVGRLEYLKKLLPLLQNQSEDCLYLNLYSPKYGGRSAAKLPVMVYIHGESFQWNAGNPHDGSVLASFGQVIVVTMNFRLGVLGFLPASEGSARGNYGLMDQFAALHWIQENIVEFGGDPKNVTIFGQSHGAACVNFLVLSPMGKGLFHRAIMMSGSALSPWSIAHEATTYAQQIARTLGCPTTLSASFLECMRQRSASDILKIQITVPEFLTGFGPTVDGIVIEREPILLMEELADDNQYANFDLIFGVTRVESYFHVSSLEERYGIDTETRDRLLRTLVRNIFNYHLQEIFLTIINEYTDWTRPIQHAINILDGSLDAIGDALVVAPAVKAATYHSVGPRKTYFYVFSYQTEDGDFPQRQGCVQGEDLHYAFGAPLVGSLAHFSRNYSKAEMALAEAVMTNWVNFARNGDPNTPFQDFDAGAEKTKGRFERTLWPQYENVHQKYLTIGMKPKVRDHYHAHRLSFWLHLFPQLHIPGSSKVALQHHLFENHDSEHAYVGAVRSVTMNHHFTKAMSTTTSSPATTETTRPAYSNGTRRKANIILSTLMPTLYPSNIERQAPTSASNSTGFLGLNFHNNIFSTALTITIAVGCCLLILNILIFFGIYYQRGKYRDEEKVHKRNYMHSNDGQAHPSSPPEMCKIPLKAPPPSPSRHAIQQQQQDLALHAQPHHAHHMHHATLLQLKIPPKACISVPPPQIIPKDSGNTPEAQPLLMNNVSSNMIFNQNDYAHHASQQMDIKL